LQHPVSLPLIAVLRRNMWNFFRVENEHLNNVGQYRSEAESPLGCLLLLSLFVTENE